ncbi:MAG: nucleotide exchange factor GrpE [Microcystaceae cyanobacterium]
MNEPQATPNDELEINETEELPTVDVVTEGTTLATDAPNLSSEIPEEETAEAFNPSQDTSTIPNDVIIATLQQELARHRTDLAEQAEQLDSYKKRYISLAAEFDNFRKRTQREREDLSKQIKGKTITELLSVVDNFERARTQLKPASDGEMDIHKSYQSVYKSFVDGLKKLGVSPMRPEGQLFDPNYHEAMLREQTNDYPEGTVIEDLVRGYLLDDLVLRHAMVKVATPLESVITSEGDAGQETSSTEDS